jgi:predicted pyridoxine 5'-phosphate oxidase superfamily flavin-nucleotide-binding protein
MNVISGMKPPDRRRIPPAVRAMQAAGLARGLPELEAHGGFKDSVTPELAAFIAQRDSFFFATAAPPAPYVQHRGGRAAPGWRMRARSRSPIAGKPPVHRSATGENDRAFLFLVDYGTRQIKVWGRARVIDDIGLTATPDAEGYAARPEQAIVLHVEAWDANCPQHSAARPRKKYGA